MVYEIISILILIDSAFALAISFTKIGDEGFEQNKFVKRYLPMTKGWSVLYAVLAIYIAYLTFKVL